MFRMKSNYVRVENCRTKPVIHSSRLRMNFLLIIIVVCFQMAGAPNIKKYTNLSKIGTGLAWSEPNYFQLENESRMAGSPRIMSSNSILNEKTKAYTSAEEIDKNRSHNTCHKLEGLARMKLSDCLPRKWLMKDEKSNSIGTRISSHSPHLSNHLHQWSGRLDLDHVLPKKWFMTAKIKNKNVKIVNGNIRKEISVIHWNMGSGHWKNQTAEINLVLNDRSPDIAIFSEANIFHDTQDYELHVPVYSLILPNMMNNLNNCRLAIRVHDGIEVKVLNEYMNDTVASV